MLSTRNWAVSGKTAPKQQRHTQPYDNSEHLSRAKFAIELAAELLFDLEKALSREIHARNVRLVEGHLRRYASLKIKAKPGMEARHVCG